MKYLRQMAYAVSIQGAAFISVNLIHRTDLYFVHSLHHISSRYIWHRPLFLRIRCHAPFIRTQTFGRAGANPSVATNTSFRGSFHLRLLSRCIIMGDYLSSGCVSYIFFRLTPQTRNLQFEYSVKTKMQQRALAGDAPRTVRETFRRLIRG